MYCKHCGKQIAEDSKFCQYCGGVQDEKMVSPISQEMKSGEQEKVIKIPSIRTNLSDKTKKWLSIYFAWLLLNLFFLVCEGISYDFSDFVFFGFLIPTVIYHIVKFWKRKKKWLSIYIAWLMLNILFLVCGGIDYDAVDYLFPFQTSDLCNYNLSEFVFYGFFIPAVIYFVVKIWKKIMG